MGDYASPLKAHHVLVYTPEPVKHEFKYRVKLASIMYSVSATHKANGLLIMGCCEAATFEEGLEGMKFLKFPETRRDSGRS